ncbi:MAG: squalene/phytoene synthase family protein [Devosiaceae bacterium]|nr:squalene/phytoene synthase family protein [Devosiaceae bacterium]
MTSHQGHIGDVLKSLDIDRYHSSLVLDNELGSDVRALYAFAADVSQIRERVSDPAVGEIRLQYWLDLISGSEYGRTENNPVASRLMYIIDRYDLPTGPLRRLLAARRFDLYDDPMADMNTFEGYAGETNSILYQLATIILNRANDAGAAAAAGHMGVAHALIGHLRSLPVTASRGQIYLPWEVFAEQGAVENDFLSGTASPEIIAACTSLRQLASEHLDIAKQEVEMLAPDIRPVFAQMPILISQLSQLNKFESVPFVTPPDLQNWQKIAKVFWWAVRIQK